MNVNEIYNLIKNAVCLQCRKDKAILDILKQLCHGESVSQIRKPGNKRNINSGIVSHDAEARVLLDNGDSNLVRYAINIPNII